ncbi:MAG TPA: NUDIX hydrolase [Candidatus Andersenbacteria bacterium]|nr:NUDIX hydrolase [Candidatus Andersenbacteria bacterium]
MYKGPLGIGVDVVIKNNEGKILLHQRTDDNSWGMLGGWVEKGETPDQAAIREVEEEAGVEVKLLQLAHVKVRDVGTVHLTYIGHVVSGDIKKSSESLVVEYKYLEEIEHWHADHKERIEEALKV